MSASQQNPKPHTKQSEKQEPQKPWYEDRWYDEPLNLQFRKFDEVRSPSLSCRRPNDILISRTSKKGPTRNTNPSNLTDPGMKIAGTTNL
jgi:hypothetical protein